MNLTRENFRAMLAAAFHVQEKLLIDKFESLDRDSLEVAVPLHPHGGGPRTLLFFYNKEGSALSVRLMEIFNEDAWQGSAYPVQENDLNSISFDVGIRLSTKDFHKFTEEATIFCVKRLVENTPKETADAVNRGFMRLCMMDTSDPTYGTINTLFVKTFSIARDLFRNPVMVSRHDEPTS